MTPTLNDPLRDAIADSEDAAFAPIWQQCRPLTSLAFEQGVALFRAVRYLIEEKIGGVIADCGIRSGHSTMIAIRTLQWLGAHRRRFVLLGCGDDAHPSRTDPARADDSAPALADDPRPSSPATIAARLAATGYEMERVHLVAGELREAARRANVPNIALLRLEARDYESLYVGLMSLYPRLVQRGVLILDRCDHRDGTRQAIEDYFGGGGPAELPRPQRPYLHRLDRTGRLAIRPDLPAPPTTRPAAEPTIRIARTRPVIPAEARYDYLPPGLRDAGLMTCFPSLAPGQIGNVRWPHLRWEAPHVWRIDRRSRAAHIGVLSLEEATLLYHLALPYAGRRGLAIGCHYGWSTAHLLAAGLHLDVVDPRLSNDEQAADVAESLNRINTSGSFRLWAGYSPSILPPLVNPAEPWAVAFVDGDHEGDAPQRDAAKVAELVAPDALVIFHDLTSEDVARGLIWLRDRGWNCRIFNTMQIVGIASRAPLPQLDYAPDPQMPPIDYPHLQSLLAE